MLFSQSCGHLNNIELVFLSITPQRVSKVDFSSIDPLSERLEECGLCVVYVNKDGAVLLVGTR